MLTADRSQISADGEDVAMFAVEIQDAQGRQVSTADNQVNFRLTGEGKVIGVGNGDPTSHEPDPGSSRKAFCGLCMALVESSKSAGSITVEANSPGLTPARLTIASKTVKLRPQVDAWEREVPAGAGVTGLWRPAEGSQIFTFRQNGGSLTGTVEGGGRGGDSPVDIQDGKVDGANISFAAANVTYTGTMTAGAIELQRSGGGRRPRRAPDASSAERPAVGPPPDGSDPSNGAVYNPGSRSGQQAPAPLVLHRTTR